MNLTNRFLVNWKSEYSSHNGLEYKLGIIYSGIRPTRRFVGIFYVHLRPLKYAAKCHFLFEMCHYYLYWSWLRYAADTFILLCVLSYIMSIFVKNSLQALYTATTEFLKIEWTCRRSTYAIFWRIIPMEFVYTGNQTQILVVGCPERSPLRQSIPFVNKSFGAYRHTITSKLIGK